MKSIPFLVCTLALAACGRESAPITSGNAEQATVPAVTAAQTSTEIKKENAGMLSGVVGLWSRQSSAAVVAAATPASDAAPELTAEERMADEIRRFREGQQRRKLRSDLGYVNPKADDRTGDKVELRQGDLAGKTTPPTSTMQHKRSEAVSIPTISPEERHAVKKRMADEIRRFKEGQALRQVQSNSAPLIAASNTPVSKDGERTGDKVGLRPGDSVGARPGDGNVSY
jgi:hypothetical protein